MKTRRITLPDPAATEALAHAMADRLTPGDTLLLDGGIGAGKTHFARALIHALQEVPEDVPSPTFTLVQTYETPTAEVWHADLYRLTGPDEVVELGLVEAFETAICLIEWPDRLSDLAPVAALFMRFETDPRQEDCRHLSLNWTDPRWDALVAGLA